MPRAKRYEKLTRKGAPEREGKEKKLSLRPFAQGFLISGGNMETRIALVGIIVEDTGMTEKINQLLHEYGSYIIGRMGVPYREKKLCIISIVMDAPNDVISTLSGKLGMLKGVSTKTVYSKAGQSHEE